MALTKLCPELSPLGIQHPLQALAMKYRTLSRGQGVPCIRTMLAALCASYSSAHEDHHLGFIVPFIQLFLSCHLRWFDSCREPSHSPCSAIISLDEQCANLRVSPL